MIFIFDMYLHILSAKTHLPLTETFEDRTLDDPVLHISHKWPMGSIRASFAAENLGSAGLSTKPPPSHKTVLSSPPNHLLGFSK